MAQIISSILQHVVNFLSLKGALLLIVSFWIDISLSGLLSARGTNAALEIPVLSKQSGSQTLKNIPKYFKVAGYIRLFSNLTYRAQVVLQYKRLFLRVP